MTRTDTVETGAPTRTVRIDPHLHTAASYDGHITPTALVERALAVGLDGVVVTDHDTVDGARVVADEAADTDLVVLTGCEVSTADGHLLAIGVDDAPDPGQSLLTTARAVRLAGGFSVVPHPFQRSRHGASAAHIEGVDGIEVYNAHTLTNYRNRQAEQFATERGYPAFGASDAHRPDAIGNAATAVEFPAGAPVTAESVFEAMRAGRTAAIRRDAATSWQYITRMVECATRKTLSLL